VWAKKKSFWGGQSGSKILWGGFTQKSRWWGGELGDMEQSFFFFESGKGCVRRVFRRGGSVLVRRVGGLYVRAVAHTRTGRDNMLWGTTVW